MAIIVLYAAIYGTLQAMQPVNAQAGEVIEQAEISQGWATEAEERQPTHCTIELCPRPVITAPGFAPLDIPLSYEMQLHAWNMCQREQIPFPVFMALIWGESRHIPDVADNINTNGTVDRGLCQINEVNWDWLAQDHGLNINDPFDNMEAGTIILGMFWHKYTPGEALTAYAWGETGMLESGEVAPSAQWVLSKATEYGWQNF